MKKHLTPLKAIRAKCLEWSGGHPKEVRLCTNTACPLHLYRLGKNPHRKGIGAKVLLINKKSLAEPKETMRKEVLND